MWREIKKIIRNYQNFIITTHVNPDGDGIGAASALIELLLKLNKQPLFVCDSQIPHKFSFLNYHRLHEIYDPEKDYGSYEVLFVLDTNKAERIGRLATLLDNNKRISVCIDHHRAEQQFFSHHVIDVHSCSVGAMIYSLFKEYALHLNIEAATAIYTSVICDTGRFCYSSTSHKSHKIADECIMAGVNPDLMHKRLFQHISLAEIKMFAKTLQAMETYLDNKVVIQQICREDCEKIEGLIDIENIDLEYIHAFNSCIEDVCCFVLLRELDEDHVRVSMRSRSDLDISNVMQSLGGGGHPNAAGLSWKGSLKEVKEKILQLLQPLFFEEKTKSYLEKF